MSIVTSNVRQAQKVFNSLELYGNNDGRSK